MHLNPRLRDHTPDRRPYRAAATQNASKPSSGGACANGASPRLYRTLPVFPVMAAPQNRACLTQNLKDFHAPEGWPPLAEADGAELACMHRLFKAALALKHHPAIATIHRHGNLPLRGCSAPDGPRERAGRGR